MQYHAGAGGNTTYRSITLDAVASSGLTTTSQPALLVLGIVVTLVGLVMMGEKDKTVGPVLMVVGFVIAMIFFATRTAALSICSNGGERIALPASGAQRESLLALLYTLDAAKLTAIGRVAEVAAPSVPPPVPYPTPPPVANRRL